MIPPMTEKWIKDTGLVFAIISLILGFKYGKEFFIISALILLLVVFIPRVFIP